VLPVELRQKDGILPSQAFDVERLENGHYLLKRAQAGNGAGVVDWLLSCPSSDWFEPLPSESIVTRNTVDFQNVGAKLIDPFTA